MDTMTINQTTKIIEILTTKQDWKGICIEVAKRNPMLFLEAAYATIKVDPIVELVKKEYSLHGKIPAIKALRTEMKIDLRAAKDRVEEIIAQYNLQYCGM